MSRTIFLTAVLILAVSASFGQPWVKHLENVTQEEEPVTFFEIQEAFQQYWGNRNMDDGHYLKNGVRRKAPGWKQFKRWEHYWEYRIDPSSGAFPETTPYLELNNYRQMRPKAVASDPSSWRNLGIDTSYGGYAGIGRLNALAFHPDNNQVIWVGSPSGGLWKTEDGGENWTIQNEETAVLGVSDIVIPADFATSQTLYIATGDRDGGSLWTLGGNQSNDNNSIGVLKSMDGGQTWESSLSFDVSSKELVTRLLMHPSDDQVLYAATSDGVYYTDDGGNTWSLISGVSFIDMEFHPGDPTIMYGSTQSYSTTRIYRSTDGGNNWQVVQDVDGSRTELSVTSDAPGRVYAVVANSSGGLQGLYRSDDQGENFQMMHSEKNLLGYYSDGSETEGQGWYDLTIQADPNHADTLFVGGINTWRSDDGGETWNCVNMWTGSSTYNKSSVPVVHADKHAMAFRTGSSVFFEGNDGGIYRSDDYGASWTDLTNGMVISQLYRLGSSQSDSLSVIAGLQDNGTKVLFSRDWYDVIGGDGMECIIDYEDNDIQYGTLYYGDIYRTTDLWNNRTSIRPLDSVNGHWATPYLINPRNPRSLYAGYNHLWKTTDRGDNWTKISDVQSDRKIRTLDVARADTQVIFMGDPQHLWRTYDGGENWEEVTGSLPVTSGYITGIEIDADSTGHIWVTIGNYNQYGVFESTDSGRTWQNIGAGLPSVPVMDVVQNRSNKRTTELYAATDIGVFRKLGEENWEIFSNNLPNVVVTELDIYYDQQDRRNNKLRAATYGRGLWETALPALNFVARPATFDAEVFPDSVGLSWEPNKSGDSLLLAVAEDTLEGVPQDGQTYLAGDLLEGGGEVLYAGKDQSAYTHSHLTTLTDYHYRLWSYDGMIYSDPREKQVTTTCDVPGNQVSSLDYPNVGLNHITLSWNRGSGDGILVTASQGSAIEKDPQSGVGYQADNTFGQGERFAGQLYVVYNGSGDSVRVEGLDRDKVYYFNLYEYNVIDSCYLKPALKGGTSTLASGSSSLTEAGFRIYPNPAGDQVVVEAPGDLKQYRCTLVDYTGKRIWVKTVEDAPRTIISTEELDAGVYIMMVETTAGQFHEKIILK